MRFFKRSLFTLMSMAGLLLLVFFLSRITGDPSYLFLPLDASPADREAFSRLHGFDDPIYVQFGRYVADLLHLDFGTSLSQQRSAMDIALEAFPHTLRLASMALAIAFAGAILCGSLAARKPGGVFDRLVSVLSLTGASTPDFWVAIILVLIFAVSLGWLPTSGVGGPAYWIMPLFVLALRPFGLLGQVVRGSMISALSSPYVKTAYAKGASQPKIIFVHALRNSMLPVITVAGDLAANLLNGAVIVETVFGWPGIGRLMIDAIMQRDFAVIQASILVTACAILILNILLDVAYVVLDPRVRHA
ncbi:ABC transporter permease [Sinorhizobium medicae]|uniref:ABC transporter permease n=1 Tax=Sinorhizobium medicae TaxID=110321 RepID=A0A6G1WH38_9HYPH|nr:ABC transporter permease [Sinorhizobium medicae]MQW69060.1 ABC transporter permease subunit [Sinorhizobium medicae]MQX87646.1 ABC transporter permease subunit [Sinorhizobium medicae]MQY01117.1 ABC transporter permease subunit [Sinorhizobium medicae]PLU08732.1 ABC transporter permease [Sinorhizobium medicae]PLU09514.1 ABC transporter permease [Sinorhizobium medicae]